MCGLCLFGNEKCRSIFLNEQSLYPNLLLYVIRCMHSMDVSWACLCLSSLFVCYPNSGDG